MKTDYLERFKQGETLAASRLLSAVERGGDEAEQVLDALFGDVGHAYRVGITGLTGSGKSTVINELTRLYRARKLTVGVIAEDPTSPFSGGAILGDRIRMSVALGDDGVFIRSIASRGNETGLSATATELADVLDAFGRDVILLETIGIGQLEHRIRYSAHTTVVVLTPDAGDDVQSMKSGLMEVGQVFVVNKSDREHAKRFADDLRSTLELRTPQGAWMPPVIDTVAVDGTGIDALESAIGRHRDHLGQDGRMEALRVDSLSARTRQLAEEKLRTVFWDSAYIVERLDGVMGDVLQGRKSPYRAAREIVEGARRAFSDGGDA